MLVKPNPKITLGELPLQVFDPERKDFLPADGREVPENGYWLRRLHQGDVVLVSSGKHKSETKDGNLV